MVKPPSDVSPVSYHLGISACDKRRVPHFTHSARVKQKGDIV
jgi:hypothetical protein